LQPLGTGWRLSVAVSDLLGRRRRSAVVPLAYRLAILMADDAEQLARHAAEIGDEVATIGFSLSNPSERPIGAEIVRRTRMLLADEPGWLSEAAYRRARFH
jgi:hypothetical protein